MYEINRLSLKTIHLSGNLFTTCRFDYSIEGHRYLMSLLAAKNTSVKDMDDWVRRCLDTIPGGP